MWGIVWEIENVVNTYFKPQTTASHLCQFVDEWWSKTAVKMNQQCEQCHSNANIAVHCQVARLKSGWGTCWVGHRNSLRVASSVFRRVLGYQGCGTGDRVVAGCGLKLRAKSSVWALQRTFAKQLSLSQPQHSTYNISKTETYTLITPLGYSDVHVRSGWVARWPLIKTISTQQINMPLLNTSTREKKKYCNFPSSKLSFSYQETWPYKTINITVTDSDELQQSFYSWKNQAFSFDQMSVLQRYCWNFKGRH